MPHLPPTCMLGSLTRNGNPPILIEAILQSRLVKLESISRQCYGGGKFSTRLSTRNLETERLRRDFDFLRISATRLSTANVENNSTVDHTKIWRPPPLAHTIESSALVYTFLKAMIKGFQKSIAMPG